MSLSALMSVSEEGVTFESPHTGEQLLLTPEKSVQIQNALGADILMQLDDVVHVLTTGSTNLIFTLLVFIIIIFHLAIFLIFAARLISLF